MTQTKREKLIEAVIASNGFRSEGHDQRDAGAIVDDILAELREPDEEMIWSAQRVPEAKWVQDAVVYAQARGFVPPISLKAEAPLRWWFAAMIDSIKGAS